MELAGAAGEPVRGEKRRGAGGIARHRSVRRLSRRSGIQYYNCWGEDSGHPIGEFCFGPSLLHGRQYYGCYYSPDDEPRGFQSVEVTLVPDGENCWTWHAEGDNRGMTKKIQDRWYYFEAWL